MKLIAAFFLLVTFVLTKGNPVQVISEYIPSSFDGNVKLCDRDDKAMEICTEGSTEDNVLLYHRVLVTKVLSTDVPLSEKYKDLSSEEDSSFFDKEKDDTLSEEYEDSSEEVQFSAQNEEGTERESME